MSLDDSWRPFAADGPAERLNQALADGKAQACAFDAIDGRAALGERLEQACCQYLVETTPGSGLGLSIVVELTRAYGGKITLGDSDMGGLKVMLELPAAEL